MTVNSFDPERALGDLNVTMTEAAIGHFSRQLQSTGHSSVRLFIQESGCSGYMYRIELVDEGQPSDTGVDIQDGLKLYVAEDARAIVQGTEIDFKKDGLNELVKFNNPNVTAECGCGESFVVESD